MDKGLIKQLVVITYLVSMSVGYAMEGRRSFDVDEPARLSAEKERCRNARRGGYQGCKNKKECGNSGEYLTIYSREGLCGTCEFKKYPNKFVGCLFCRKPILKVYPDMKSFTCLRCFPNLVNFVNRVLNNYAKDGKPVEDISHWLNRLRLTMDESISRGYIAAFKNDETYKEIFNNKTPGIYLGAMRADNGNIIHAWVPEVEIDHRDINEEMDGEEIYSLINKYCILGPKTGDLLLKVIPDGALTYEEKIAKSI